MKKIFKYELKVEDYQTLQLPEGAMFLTVKAVGIRLFLWCMVDPEQTEMVKVNFRLAGTGHEISDEEAEHLRYIGTFFLQNGLVFHLFLMLHAVCIPYVPFKVEKGEKL